MPLAPSPAALAKEKGNAAFKAGDFPAAVGHYSAAIVADPSDHTLPLNRAAAYLKLSKNEDAERDCTRVLSLSKHNVKAIFRRGQARTGLQKYGEAQKDFHDALQLEPSNETVKTELARVNALINKGKAKATSKSAPLDVPSPPLNANPATPKRRRIPIKTVEPPPAAPTPPASFDPSPSSTSKTTSGTSDLLSPVSSRTIPKAPAKSEGPSSPPAQNAPPPKPTTFKDAKQARASKAGGGIFRASGQHTVFDRDRSAASASPSAPSPPPPPAADARTAIPTPPPDGPSTSAVPPPASEDGSGKLPWTLFSFLRAWESANAPIDRWKLLAALPPPLLPKLCQTSLEPTLLVSMVRTFGELLSDAAYGAQAAELGAWTRAYLEHLAKVSRFGTNVMFLSQEEKALVGDVLRRVDADAEMLRAWGVGSPGDGQR